MFIINGSILGKRSPPFRSQLRMAFKRPLFARRGVCAAARFVVVICFAGLFAREQLIHISCSCCYLIPVGGLFSCGDIVVIEGVFL